MASLLCAVATVDCDPGPTPADWAEFCRWCDALDREADAFLARPDGCDPAGVAARCAAIGEPDPFN